MSNGIELDDPIRMQNETLIKNSTDCTLKPLQIDIVIFCLKSIKNALNILGRTCGSPKGSIAATNKIDSKTIFQPDTLELMDQSIHKTIEEKLNNDILNIESDIERIITDLKMRKSYDVILNLLNLNLSKRDEENQFLTEYTRSIYTLDKITKFYEKCKSDAESIVGKMETEILNSETKLHDTIITENIKMRFQKAFIDTIANQTTKTINTTAEEKIKAAELYVKKSIDEELISNIQNDFIDGKIKAATDLADFWVKKYEEDSEQVEENLLDQRIKYEFQLAATNKVKMMYEKRLKYIQDYKQKLQRYEDAKKTCLYRYQCATIIQAWWRGVMVRRNLGQFKKPIKRKLRKSQLKRKLKFNKTKPFYYV